MGVWHLGLVRVLYPKYGYFWSSTLFLCIFYNHGGHSCLVGSDNNVRLTLHVRPKAFGFGVVLDLR